jgi:hypothetical protein
MPCRFIAIAAVAFIALLASRIDAGEESIAERRERLEKMTDAEKTLLLEKKRTFDELSSADKKRLKRLHEQLVKDEKSDELLRTLRRYKDWRGTLPAHQRAELAKAPLEKRLELIKKYMDDQAKERFLLMLRDSKALDELLSPEDREHISQWTDQFLLRHKEDILSVAREHAQARGFDTDNWRTDVEDYKLVHLLRFTYFRAGQHPFSGPPRPRPGSGRPGGNGQKGAGERSDPADEILQRMPQPTRKEEDELASRVSQKARDALNAATKEGERSRIIQNWMRAASLSRFMPPVSPEALDRFVDTLDKDDRAELESLPRDRMFAELRKLYFRKASRWGHGPWSGRGRGGRDERGFEGRRGPRGGPPGQGPPRPPPGEGKPPGLPPAKQDDDQRR